MAVYLDWAATAPPSTAAMAAFSRASESAWGNPASLHAAGRAAAALLEESRRAVAERLGVLPEEVIFTSGGTESNNLALKAAAAVHGRRRKHIVSTTLEHPSVMESVKALEAQGFEATLVPPEHDGCISTEKILKACRPDTVIVSVCGACSETGALMPPELGAVLKAAFPDTLLHIDAVQVFGRYPCRPAELCCDLLSLSGHKLGAPKGIGALYIRAGLRMRPELHGGGQERGLRAGTANAPLAAALAAALDEPQAAAAADYAYHRLESLPGITLIAPARRAPHILAFAAGLPGEVLTRMLSDKGVYISAGSACKRGKAGEAVKSMRLPPGLAANAVRASFGAGTAAADIDALCAALREIMP